MKGKGKRRHSKAQALCSTYIHTYIHGCMFITLSFLSSFAPIHQESHKLSQTSRGARQNKLSIHFLSIFSPFPPTRDMFRTRYALIASLSRRSTYPQSLTKLIELHSEPIQVEEEECHGDAVGQQNAIVPGHRARPQPYTIELESGIRQWISSSGW